MGSLRKWPIVACRWKKHNGAFLGAQSIFGHGFLTRCGRWVQFGFSLRLGSSWLGELFTMTWEWDLFMKHIWEIRNHKTVHVKWCNWGYGTRECEFIHSFDIWYKWNFHDDVMGIEWDNYWYINPQDGDLTGDIPMISWGKSCYCEMKPIV